MLKDLVLRSRSYRRYDQSQAVSGETLRGLVELTRYCPSARNVQPLRYLPVNTPEDCARLFDCTAWALSLGAGKGTPPEGQRPPAYLILLGDTELSKNFFCDDGIAAQTILLGATEMGLGGIILWSVNRDKIRELFAIPERYEIRFVVALGKPAEKVVIEDLPADGSIDYWRDEDLTHHVPKRALDDLIVDFGKEP